jgi:hypothetical protein
MADEKLSNILGRKRDASLEYCSITRAAGTTEL